MSKHKGERVEVIGNFLALSRKLAPPGHSDLSQAFCRS